MSKLYIVNPRAFTPDVQKDMTRWWGGEEGVTYQTDQRGNAVIVDLQGYAARGPDAAINRLASFLVGGQRMDDAGVVTGDIGAFNHDLPYPVRWNGKPLALEPSLGVRNHSPTGFAWGYQGSGPAQLALAIMLKLMPRPEAEARYLRFKMDTIAMLPMREGFRLEVADIMIWITARRLEPCGHEGELRARCRLCGTLLLV